jgi:hypothetical protein
VRAALAEIPGVGGVEMGEPGEAAGVEFFLQAEAPRDVQRRLATIVVGRGWTLLEMRVEEPTLEDLFVRVVG